MVMFNRPFPLDCLLSWRSPPPRPRDAN